MTQEELAQKAGLSRFTVARTEKGEPARYSTVRKFAVALRVDPDQLMAEDRPKSRAA
jgi:transcriptional regulator with XRE-family HTH domain